MKFQCRIVLLGLFGFFSGLQVFAQTETENATKYRKSFDFEMPSIEVPSEGNHTGQVLMVPRDSFGVYYIIDPELADLVDLHIALNEKITAAPGFRIQIYAGSQMEHANEAKADFIEAFSELDIPIYQKWQPPHFRVRVGDFLSKTAAMREMAMVRQVFPDAFIVSDLVKVPKYKKAIIPEDGMSPEGRNGDVPHN